MEMATDIERVFRLVLQKQVDYQTLGLQSRSRPRNRSRFAGPWEPLNEDQFCIAHGVRMLCTLFCRPSIDH
jgi:hypothetical protein